jgi:hypothetical protein
MHFLKRKLTSQDFSQKLILTIGEVHDYSQTDVMREGYKELLYGGLYRVILK